MKPKNSYTRVKNLILTEDVVSYGRSCLFIFILLLISISNLIAQKPVFIWEGGSTEEYRPGTYGTKGVGSTFNIPGARKESISWTDSDGNLWLFGGEYHGDYFNDLWRYEPVSTEWTWMGGSDQIDQTGIYGTLGISDTDNIPGARMRAVSWIDSSDNMWLFGGLGYDAEGNFGPLNDLWKYIPTTGEWTWMVPISIGKSFSGLSDNINL